MSAVQHQAASVISTMDHVFLIIPPVILSSFPSFKNVLLLPHDDQMIRSDLDGHAVVDPLFAGKKEVQYSFLQSSV